MAYMPYCQLLNTLLCDMFIFSVVIKMGLKVGIIEMIENIDSDFANTCKSMFTFK